MARYSFDPGRWRWYKKDSLEQAPGPPLLIEQSIDLTARSLEQECASKVEEMRAIHNSSAQESSAKTPLVIWRLALDQRLAPFSLDPLDPDQIAARTFALKYFLSTLTQEDLDHSLGVVIDTLHWSEPMKRFCLDGVKELPKSHRIEEFYSSWLAQDPLLSIREPHSSQGRPDLRSLSRLDRCRFALELYDSLWALLASCLPDSIHAFLHLEEFTQELSLAQKALLLSRTSIESCSVLSSSLDPRLVALPLSRDRSKQEANSSMDLSYFALGPTCQPFSSPYPSPRAALLAPHYDGHPLRGWDSFWPALGKSLEEEASFRIINESQLMHLWQDLEVVICPYLVRDRQTLRQMAGFEAAGGRALYAQEEREMRALYGKARAIFTAMQLEEPLP